MKKAICFLLILVLMLSLCACGKTATPSAKTVEFTDDLGRTVQIPEKIERIVPTAALAQIILYAIAPDLFVGLADHWDESAKGIISDEAMNLPYFGSFYSSSDLNIETLAAADPQIIIDIGEIKSSSTDDLDTLQTQTGIPTVYIGATLETMPQTYRTLGKLLDREEKAEELAQFCERIYERTLSIVDEVGENKVNALFVLGEEGLNVMAQNSYHAEVMDLLTNNLAVVENPLSKGSGNAVTMEQIALWNPDFVIFAPDSIYETAKTTPSWNEVSAIGNDRYVKVPDAPHNWMSMPPSVQRYLSMIWLPSLLYPQYCDYDAQADILEYYRLFYGCELTQAQYETITEGAFR